jgi:hypothetical protein
MGPDAFAREALAADLPPAADPRPTRRIRYRLLAKARQNEYSVVAVVSFSSDGLWLTHHCYTFDRGQWEFLGGSGRDLDWEEIPPLPAGEGPVTLTRSSAGFGFPAWRHLHVPSNGRGTLTSGQGSEPNNGHLITFD